MTAHVTLRWELELDYHNWKVLGIFFLHMLYIFPVFSASIPPPGPLRPPRSPGGVPRPQGHPGRLHSQDLHRQDDQQQQQQEQQGRSGEIRRAIPIHILAQAEWQEWVIA